MRQTIRNIARQSRRNELFWRYGFNFAPSFNYRLAGSRRLDEFSRFIVSELDEKGIAVAAVEDVPALTAAFSKLSRQTDELLDARRDELAILKAEATDRTKIGEKTFLAQLLGRAVEFEPDSIFARFALEETFLDIAEEYFKMLVKLRYYNIWLTFATQESAPRESQLWHYDREDKYILKVFLYLNDVTAGAGPFTYAPRTHPKGAFKDSEPEFFMENGVRRTTDAQMGEIISPNDWLTATGKKGTLVFADTRGFHKGGEARTSDRLMFTFMFTSPASDSERLIKFPAELPPNKLSRRQLEALEI